MATALGALSDKDKQDLIMKVHPILSSPHHQLYGLACPTRYNEGGTGCPVSWSSFRLTAHVRSVVGVSGSRSTGIMEWGTARETGKRNGALYKGHKGGQKGNGGLLSCLARTV